MLKKPINFLLWLAPLGANISLISKKTYTEDNAFSFSYYPLPHPKATYNKRPPELTIYYEETRESQYSPTKNIKEETKVFWTYLLAPPLSWPAHPLRCNPGLPLQLLSKLSFTKPRSGGFSSMLNSCFVIHDNMSFPIVGKPIRYTLLPISQTTVSISLNTCSEQITEQSSISND